MEFIDDRHNPIEVAKDDIKREIDNSLLKQEPQQLSHLLSDLDLIPLHHRVLEQYESPGRAGYGPLSMVKLLVYKDVLTLSEKDLINHLHEHLDNTERLGFSLTEIPETDTIQQFKHHRVTSDINELIGYTSAYIRNNCSELIQEDVERAEAIEEISLYPAAEEDVSYEQDWPAYNEAQMNEKLDFKRFASALLASVEEKSETSAGPNGFSLKTKVFSLLLKEYTGKSGRRVISELKEAEEQGYVDEVPHFNTIYNFYDEPGMASLLKTLIQISARPLKDFEENFTADATGLSTDLYRSWHETKFGEKKQRKEFLKLHVMSGVKTNIITSVEVTEGTAGDSPEFTGLLQETAKHFEIKEVSADKAYSSRENVEAVTEEGAVPYIPFRSNVTGKAKGSMTWRRMHQYFHQNQQQFMRHYHKRSNAESVFAMMKQKIGTKINSEKPIAQFNEALAKCLVHNLIVLIHEMYELGVEIDFNYCAERVLAQQ